MTVVDSAVAWTAGVVAAEELLGAGAVEAAGAGGVAGAVDCVVCLAAGELGETVFGFVFWR
jgi:hypothetical protein